jgi:hypothetical protein
MNVLDMSKEVCKAAKTVAMQWPGVVEADDMEQDIYLHLLESPGSVEKLLTEFTDKNRLNALIAIGHKIASKERVDYERFSGNFRYSVNEVKGLLQKQTFKEANLGRTSTSADLLAGMETLRKSSPQYAEMIQRRYVKGETFGPSAEAMQLSRAVEALTTEMNRSFSKQDRDHQGPGNRKMVSNSAATAHTAKEYNGENLKWGS